MPVRVLVTEGTAADCSQAVELIEGIDAEYLLADKAYDTNAILSYCEEHEVIPVVPPKRNQLRRRLWIASQLRVMPAALRRGAERCTT